MRFVCKKCQAFLLEIKNNGSIEINNRARNIVLFPEKIKLSCQCKKEYFFKSVISYDIIETNN